MILTLDADLFRWVRGIEKANPHFVGGDSLILLALASLSPEDQMDPRWDLKVAEASGATPATVRHTLQRCKFLGLPGLSGSLTPKAPIARFRVVTDDEEQHVEAPLTSGDVVEVLSGRRGPTKHWRVICYLDGHFALEPENALNERRRRALAGLWWNPALVYERSLDISLVRRGGLSSPCDHRVSAGLVWQHRKTGRLVRVEGATVVQEKADRWGIARRTLYWPLVAVETGRRSRMIRRNFLKDYAPNWPSAKEAEG